jgi:hypothetical protein
MDSKKYWIGTEKSVNNSANSAGAARPTNKGNGALAPGHPWAFKLGNNPLKNPSISAVTAEQSRPRVVVRLADEMQAISCLQAVARSKNPQTSARTARSTPISKNRERTVRTVRTVCHPPRCSSRRHTGCSPAVYQPSKCHRNAVEMPSTSTQVLALFPCCITAPGSGSSGGTNDQRRVGSR